MSALLFLFLLFLWSSVVESRVCVGSVLVSGKDTENEYFSVAELLILIQLCIHLVSLCYVFVLCWVFMINLVLHKTFLHTMHRCSEIQDVSNRLHVRAQASQSIQLAVMDFVRTVSLSFLFLKYEISSNYAIHNHLIRVFLFCPTPLPKHTHTHTHTFQLGQQIHPNVCHHYKQ